MQVQPGECQPGMSFSEYDPTDLALPSVKDGTPARIHGNATLAPHMVLVELRDSCRACSVVGALLQSPPHSWERVLLCFDLPVGDDRPMTEAAPRCPRNKNGTKMAGSALSPTATRLPGR